MSLNNKCIPCFCLDQSSSFTLQCKQLSFTDDILTNSPSTPIRRLSLSDNLENSNAGGKIHFRGVNSFADDSPFLQYKNLNKTSQHSSNGARCDSSKIKRIMLPSELTPILKNRSKVITNKLLDGMIAPPSTSFEEKNDQSFNISFPNNIVTPDSPVYSPMQMDSVYLSRSRLTRMEHSVRTTSTPNNTTSINRSSKNNCDEFVDCSRRNLFQAKDDAEIEVDEIKEDVGKENVSGMSWNEGMSNLIGDFSAPFKLPLCTSKHPDLKAISPNMMAEVLSGIYGDVLGRYVVVDCRYPFEFVGGHIKGAINIYNQDEIITRFFTSPQDEQGQLIIFFHCEFSSERAPKMMRFLRNQDRTENQAHYPTLCYPELYLLEGGYSAFFKLHPNHCNPTAYIPMLHPDYLEDLKIVQSKRRLVEDEIAKNGIIQRAIQNQCGSSVNSSY